MPDSPRLALTRWMLKTLLARQFPPDLPIVEQRALMDKSVKSRWR